MNVNSTESPTKLPRRSIVLDFNSGNAVVASVKSPPASAAVQLSSVLGQGIVTALQLDVDEDETKKVYVETDRLSSSANNLLTTGAIDVKALARKRVSQAFAGYNVADIHDDPQAVAAVKEKEMRRKRAADAVSPLVVALSVSHTGREDSDTRQSPLASALDAGSEIRSDLPADLPVVLESEGGQNQGSADNVMLTEVKEELSSCSSDTDSDAFDPSTFKLYQPALDVDALCSELIDFAGDILANPAAHLQTGNMQGAGNEYDAEEALAKERMQRHARNGEIVEEGDSSHQGTDASVSHRQIDGPPSTTPIRPDNSGSFTGSNRRIGSVRKEGSFRSSQPAHQRKVSVQIGREHSISGRAAIRPLGRQASMGRQPAASPPPSDKAINEVSDTFALPLDTMNVFQNMMQNAAALRRKRNAMLLEGLRRGDFNADFIRSVQQLGKVEDAIGAIKAYYAEGRDAAHHAKMGFRRMSMRSRQSSVAAGRGAHDESGGGTSVNGDAAAVTIVDSDVRPRSGGGARGSRVHFHGLGNHIPEGKERSATPPSGLTERRSMLLRALELRRESEIRRLNEGSEATNDALQRRRSTQRLNSLSGKADGARRKSSVLVSAGQPLAPLATLSNAAIWRERCGDHAEATPDVCLLFFALEGSRRTTGVDESLSIQDILNSTAKYLGTVSYVHFFPTAPETDVESELAKSDDANVAPVVVPRHMMVTEDDAFDMVEGIVRTEPELQRAVPSSPSAGAEPLEERHLQDRLHEILFARLHRCVEEYLKASGGSDSPSSLSGVLFFSSISQSGLTADHVELMDGRQLRVCRWHPVRSTRDSPTPRERKSKRKLRKVGPTASGGSESSIAGEAHSGPAGTSPSRRRAPLQTRTTGESRAVDTAESLEPWQGRESPTAQKFAKGQSVANVNMVPLAHHDPPHKPPVRSDSLVFACGTLMGVVKGIDDHFFRIARNRMSVQVYPKQRKGHSVAVLSKSEAALTERLTSPTSISSRCESRHCACRTVSQTASLLSCRVMLEDQESAMFPPVGLDCAPSVRPGQTPRGFDNLPPSPRPPVRVFPVSPRVPSRHHHMQSDRHSCSCSCDTSTMTSLANTLPVSSSGCVVHRVQPLPEKVLRTPRTPISGKVAPRLARNADTAMEEPSPAQQLFPLLIQPKHALNTTPRTHLLRHDNRVSHPGTVTPSLPAGTPNSSGLEAAPLSESGMAVRRLVASRQSSRAQSFQMCV